MNIININLRMSDTFLDQPSSGTLKTAEQDLQTFPEHPDYERDLCCSMFSFLGNALSSIVCICCPLFQWTNLDNQFLLHSGDFASNILQN